MSGDHSTPDDHDPVPRELGSSLSSSVALGQVVLWCGRPDARVVFMPEDLVLIPFTVLWCQWPLRTAHGRPAEMPAGGHENCPLMANRSAHQGVGGVGHVEASSVNSSR